MVSDVARFVVPHSPGSDIRRNLGLPTKLAHQLVSYGTPFQRFMEVSSWLATPVDFIIAWLIPRLPVVAVSKAVRFLFALFVQVHKCLPASLAHRGLSDTLSIEAHALSTCMWWGRLIPINTTRARNALSSMQFVYPPTKLLKEEIVDFPDQGVRGIYLHTAPEDAEDPMVLLHFFGGGFVGGSAHDNRGFVENYARSIGCDAFIASYRVCPEYLIDDAFVDGCRAYEWLLARKAPSKIVICGVSSGGGVAARVLQLARSHKGSAQEEGCRIYFQSEGPIPQPAAAVLVAPFINFTVGPSVDTGNSQMKHLDIDLFVNPRMAEFLHALLDAACGGRGEDGKIAASPIFQDVDGLCPVYLSYSRHEVCADDCMELTRKLRAKGGTVTVSDVPFLCHAYLMFAAFIPEAQGEFGRIINWVKQFDTTIKSTTTLK